MPVDNISGKILLAGLDPEKLAALLQRNGIEIRYARRLLYWLYVRGIKSFSQINDIPKKVLSELDNYFGTGLFEPDSICQSSDGSVKFLFRNSAGLAYETVYLPDGKRNTVCVSVQSGCRMGCRFCATGKNGWKGNLTAGEIVNQVISLPYKATHIVMMGMGEPGDNIEEVISACRILTAGWGMAIGRTKVTISTVGILPSLERLLNETGCNITLSLHSPFPEERRQVIPSEKSWPFCEATELLKRFNRDRNRRFTVAYVMIKGINDTQRHLDELKKLLSGSKIKINLLPYHPFDGDEQVTSDNATMMMFKHMLVTSGIEATVRKSRGSDIAAACGMLAEREGRSEL